jgi:mono/diheme cytochrome c family protein
MKPYERFGKTGWRVGLGALLVGVSGWLLAAANLGDVSKLPAPSAQAGLTYAKEIKPLFEKACVKCHSGDRPKGKYRIDTRENAIKGGGDGEAAIVPGKSDKSPLVHYVADLVPDMEMPPLDKRDQFPRLTQEEIALLRAWINQGAK